MTEWLTQAGFAAAFLAAGAFAGLAMGAVGVGGGLLLAPALHHLLETAGLHGAPVARQAAAAALAALAALALRAALAQARAGGVDWRPLALGAPVAALTGGFGAWGASLASGLGPMALWGAVAFLAALGIGAGLAGAPWGRGWPGGAAGAGLAALIGLGAGGGATGAGALVGPLAARFTVESRQAAALGAGLGAAACAPAALVWVFADPGGPATPFALGALDPVGALLAALAAAGVAPQGARLAREAPALAIRLGFAFLAGVTALSFLAQAARG